MPRLSVLLLCRHAAATLAEAVVSQVRQDFRDFEVVAVDDGSHQCRMAPECPQNAPWMSQERSGEVLAEGGSVAA